MNFQKELISWYSINKRELPWRSTKNPYFIWLSEIILQQTQVNQGLPYYEAFTHTFPTVFKLAEASEEEVLKLWQGLGYYSRARNLHTSAKFIANELNGQFPSTYSEIVKLKGVGDYTASAIASIVFNEATAVVDGNVYRVLSRYFGIDTPINTSKGIKQFKELASTLIPHDNPGNYNQALMEFGARQCKPKSPNCAICPLKNSCMAKKKYRIDQLPVKLKKTKITKKYFNFLVFLDNSGKTVLDKRTAKGIWQNLYQFPLIETDKSLDHTEFELLKQELDSLSFKVLDYSLYNTEDKIHKLSHQHLYTKFWILEVDSLPNTAIKIEKLDTFPMPVLISNFVEEFNFATD
ncbi:A/G-specific adenine glycosylase [Winogradskyella poriferorum]|uniref:A/G-specific adenine glycosylase n=1 Tax=Winogradskyella poriferorum TaxID=307627 RepID=UPI003D647603